jgi:hypothetical protein
MIIGGIEEVKERFKTLGTSRLPDLLKRDCEMLLWYVGILEASNRQLREVVQKHEENEKELMERMNSLSLMKAEEAATTKETIRELKAEAC